MSTPPIRIYLSPPDVGPRERELLLDAFDSNWIAPLGPQIDAFEHEIAERCGTGHAVALSSGTAALHLALLLYGVRPDDEVLCSTLTFAATANAITYVGARPVFVDAEPAGWNLDQELVVEELERAAARNQLPAAIITVDLYGRVADHDPILEAAAPYGVPVIEDAAEALGATYKGRPAGSLGHAGVLSFNGNKIITTSGGGMLVTDDGALAERARFLATQARDSAPHYEHSTIGFNYRMSNLLAALGRGQLEGLDAKVARRREINARYRKALGDLPGAAFLAEDPYGEPNNWLTVLTIDPAEAVVDREAVRMALLTEGIEARPVWKPMHDQPVFASTRTVARSGRGEVASRIFAHGLCLPSGSNLTEDDQDDVITVVQSVLRGS